MCNKFLSKLTCLSKPVRATDFNFKKSTLNPLSVNFPIGNDIYKNAGPSYLQNVLECYFILICLKVLYQTQAKLNHARNF
jgi:hypothetical protein